MKKINNHNRGFQRGFGCVGVLLQAGLAITDYAEPDDLFLGPVYFAFAVLFLATALFSFLGPLQAALFFCLSAVETLSSQNCVYGIGFAAVAAIILFRRGWFFRKAMVKGSIVLGLGSAFLILPILVSKKPPIALAPAFISAAIYSVLVIALARGRFLSALAPMKPSLRLASFKLNMRETQAVKGRMQGKTVKEIAYESGKAESTIRNALSTACRKLEIQGREDLLALGERYRVE